ncbi:dual 3',5'-cyclic-AMP and -GMP phosphodiesterase 11 isoform X2 [Apis mellifera caucasica]|nr:dual 3',5'-cyclic-AMP and -GMP phosphodiesterase 11 isoform X2 [Apis mellifera caucasica]KAG9430347.1 dual 3',5'-cyclic-AMP and -GMP phosphodiesterase 11 isoform X2 [Apis mellifera carnica]
MALDRQSRCETIRDTKRKLFCICTCSYTAASPENDDTIHCFRTRNAVKLAASAGNPSAAVAASAHPPVLWSSRRKPELSMQTILEGRKILNILRYIKSRICFRRWMLIWEDFGILLSLMMEYPIPKLDFQSMKEKSRITS